MKEYKEALTGINHLAFLKRIRGRAFKFNGRINVEFAACPVPVPFEKRTELNYAEAKKLSALAKQGETAWLHLTADIPEETHQDNAYIWLDVWGEGTVFDQNGTPVAGLGTVVSVSGVLQNPIAKKTFQIPPYCFEQGKIDIWVQVSNNGLFGKSYGPSRLVRAEIFSLNHAWQEFYYDYLAVYLAMRAKTAQQRKFDLTALKTAQKKCFKSISEGREALAQVLSQGTDSDITITALGHSHLDVAWLWKVDETQRKAARTFANQLNNTERYPGYIFGASQPLEYLWLKENHPELYAKVKAAVAEGKIEPLGGMWLEPDINLIGGESLIRQIMYGKKFWSEEFNVDTKICWLPDVFGFSGSLPQILKKTGMDYFLTIKLSWNEINEFPYTSFNWEGIDGSRVLAHMPPEGNYGSDLAPHSIKIALRKNKDDTETVKDFLMPFGDSDGGGGAGEVHFEMLKRIQNLSGLPKIVQSSGAEFFQKLSAIKDKLPTFRGELYLETHQGTYTTQSMQKHYNRRAERLLHNMEVMGCLTVKAGGEYDFSRAEALWKDCLLEQFHDLLPGSSTDGVHAESIARYKKFLPQIEHFTGEMAAAVIKDGKSLSAVNFSPVAQRGYYHTSSGWIYLELAPYSAKPVVIRPILTNKLSFGADYIENDILKVNFAPDGSIDSVILVESGEEFSANGLNRLNIYRDKRLWWNACNIDYAYRDKEPRPLKLISSTYFIDGATVVRKNIMVYNKSRLVQKIILNLECPYITFDTTVNWNETHKMLRADFYPAHYGDGAVCDVQFGNIRRSTASVTSEEIGQLEICAHKYLDVSDETGGSAVITQSKHGYRAKDGLVSLNLLRSPVFPAKHADKGTHKFSYAFYPHTGDTFNSKVIEHSYAFNNPVSFINGSLGFKCLAIADKANIIIETIKPAEQGGYILRAYESHGKDVDVAIKTGFTYIYCYECDMLENIHNTAKPDALHFSPYEIKTLLFK